MELKKNPNADLTKQRGLYLSIGFVLSLLLVITEFEWKFYDEGSLVDLGKLEESFEEMLDIPPTEHPPPPPPKIQQPEVIEVPDEEEVEEEIEIDLDVEITEETVIEELIAVEVQEEEVEEIFTFVETMPFPEMGYKAFYSYIAKNLKYPPQALKMRLEGKVFIQFLIDKKGNVVDLKVVRGIGGGLDEEAMRVFKNSPKWKPGLQRGKPQIVQMIIPITFKLG